MLRLILTPLVHLGLRAVGSRGLIRDHGACGDFLWYAVPRQEADAFASSNPHATASRVLLTGLGMLVGASPRGFPAVLPFLDFLRDAQDAYPDCEVFAEAADRS